MWGACGNGSSGYVSKARGWEFVPCSSSERDSKRVPSEFVRVRSFPSNLLEQILPRPAPAAASNAICGQTSYQELQSQHTRLQKNYEELKQHYYQEREAWRMEKEMFLRQCADIQGGENKRILLHMRSVLEEVQSGVKREESKQSELELQYIKDRCAWELERAELKSHITQLEVRGCSIREESVRGPEQADTIKREKAEQKRLLADTHSAAMDLRYMLEKSERGWVKEKSELLERFDSERKEWENQLLNMQHKIEELYNEVKAQSKGSPLKPTTNPKNSTSRLSSSSVSTLLSDAQSNEYSEALTQQSDASIDSPNQPYHNSSESNNWCNRDQNELLNLQGDEKHELGKQIIDTAELEEILESCLKLKNGNKSCFTGQDDLLKPFRVFQSMEINCESDKKKNNTALNAALKEIACVSKELCSYQDEMRKLPYMKRSCTQSVHFPGEGKMVVKVRDNFEMEDTALHLKNWSTEIKTLDEQYWMSWEQEEKQTTSGAESWANKSQHAPPIPAHSTSWYLSSSSATESESNDTEPLIIRGCQKTGANLDRKCNSPAIVQKFEEMLQENEGKILIDSGNITCTVPVDSKSYTSCCQSQSCDVNRFGSIKSSNHVPFKRCLSNIYVATAAEECSLNQVDPKDKNDPKCASHSMGLYYMPTESTTSLDIVLPYDNATDSHRNETLQQKTAEFNRIIFQAGMGCRCDDENPIDCGLACSTSLPVFKSKDTSSPSRYAENKMKDLMAQFPKEELLQMKPQKAPQLKSKTKDVVSRGSSLQQEASLKELPLGLSDHAARDFSSSKTVFICPTKQERKDNSLWLENRKATPVVQFGPSVGEKCFEFSITPPQMKTKIKTLDVNTDQNQGDPKSKQDTRSRILEDNPWKPSTLAAYPRPVESRSNYGAVERILKSYENLDRGQDQQQSQPIPKKEEDLMDLLEMFDIRHKSRCSQRLTHTLHHHVIAHKETHVRVQQGKGSSVTIKKSFSRPARPARRRLPLHWASRSSLSTPSPPQQHHPQSSPISKHSPTPPITQTHSSKMCKSLGQHAV